MCMSKQPDPPPPPPPPPAPPPVLEQAAPVMDNGLTIENGVRKKRIGTKKYSSASSSLGSAGAGAASPTTNGLG